MFQNARDVAEAALHLVEMARVASQYGDLPRVSALEIAAAVLAVHVSDWHVSEHGYANLRIEMFKAFSQDWEALRLLSKGLKHAKPNGDQPTQRNTDWEDVDGWELGFASGTLFVPVDGKDRSVRIMTEHFCEEYLARGSTIAPPTA